jgi:hypothetical protein
MFNGPAEGLVEFFGNKGAVAGGWQAFDAEKDDDFGVGG